MERRTSALALVLLLLAGLFPAAAATKPNRASFPFNGLISDGDLEKLTAGEIVIRNIRDRKNMCMPRGVCPYADEILGMFTELNPGYLAEILYMFPVEGNSDASIIGQSDAIFSDWPLYKEVIYTDEDTGKSKHLFPEAELVKRTDRYRWKSIWTHVKMDFLAPYDTELIIKTTDDTFFFSQINQEAMKYKFVTAVRPKNMQAAICCFKYRGNWFVYALGGVKAPVIPFVRNKIDHQFIGRIEDFTVFYINRFDIKR
ncbi:MAG: hypothetical protein ILP18_08185 [Treponema sp.]|nr:hypothetical protein [Treponema sp.]